MTVAAVVLAAGGSTRFAGGHKLLAPFRGKPLARWAIDHALAAQLDQTIVVTGATELEVPAGVTVVRNERWAEGMAVSLHAGIAAASDAHAVVIAQADQPMLVPEAWRMVARCDAPIAVALYGDRKGSPVRLSKAVWPLLPTSGDIGARELIAARPDLVRTVPCPGDPTDIDTLEDLEQWS